MVRGAPEPTSLPGASAPKPHSPTAVHYGLHGDGKPQLSSGYPFHLSNITQGDGIGGEMRSGAQGSRHWEDRVGLRA